MAAAPSLSPTERLLPSLMEGDTDDTNALFGENGDVDDPFNGHVVEPHFYVWAAARHLFLRGYKARLEPVKTTRAGSRACAEAVLHFDDFKGRKVSLPVAVVGDEAGDKLRRARLYHSMWPLYDSHELRPPTLPGDPDLALRADDPVGVYQRALAAGDVEGLLATLELDAVVREPSGGEFTYVTAEARRKLYEGMLAKGGIPLEHCAFIDDGETCAVEYTVRRWGETDLVPQAGVAVYTRGPRHKLVAVRIYDDVEPPTE